MPSLARNTERIMSILHELPAAKVTEIVDFAEYLRSRTRKTVRINKKVTEFPAYHLGAVSTDAFDRSSIYGDRLDAELA